MASRKRRKRAAQAQGLTEAELQLCELLEEVLDALKWSQVLSWGNQYLLQQHLSVSSEERDRVMKAAARTVDEDGRILAWQQRLDEIRDKLAGIDRNLRRGADASAPDDGSRPEPAPPSSPASAEAADGA